MFAVLDMDGRICAIFPHEDEAKDWRTHNHPTCTIAAGYFSSSPVYRKKCASCNGEGFSWEPKS